MKRLLGCLLFSIVAGHVSAQTPYLWPVEGVKAGEGIIYTPQSHIDGELNFDNLFIAAPEGTEVVAPCDGTIRSYGLTYNTSLNTTTGWSIDDSKSIDQRRAEIMASGNLEKRGFNPTYFNGDVGIVTPDGFTIWILGLSGDKTFKTGQKIERGTPLGRVAYSYYKIPEPSIRVSISEGGRSSDPMTPFGLKTTYIPPAEEKPVTALTKEQAAEDFTIFVDAVKECFVGLYNVVTPEEMEQYVQKTLEGINSREGDLPYADFVAIMREAVALVHDSHIGISIPRWYRVDWGDYLPGFAFAFYGDTMLLTNTSEKYRHLIARRIAKINNATAEEIRSVVSSRIPGYDAKSEGYRDFVLGGPGFLLFIGDPRYFVPSLDMEVEFADGENVTIPGHNVKKDGPSDWVTSDGVFASLNRPRAGYATKMLTDSVAYLGIGTFGLNRVQTEEIGAFIDSIAAVPNLVIDVRNNDGGTDEVISRLYSYIAGEPMTLHGYSKVNSNAKYETFKNSFNQIPDSEIFPDYKPEEGKDGFYDRPETGTVVKADSLVNYKGRIYMLTNGRSSSAATLFPAMLVRNHRGVTVGRETRSAYHFMNAVKFVEVRLPASLIKVRLPLVETHFDSVVNERVPYGRGVMPDYPVPLSYEEVVSEDDVMLDYTLGLIERGEYLRGDDPFAGSNPEDKTPLPLWAWISIAAGAVALGVSIYAIAHKPTLRPAPSARR